MKLVITTIEGNIFPIEISPDIELINLKALCEQETQIEVGKMSVLHEGKLLSDDSKSVSSYNIKEDDVLMIQQKQQQTGNLPMIDFSSISVPSTTRPRSSNSGSQSSASASNMANMMRMVMSDPARFEQIRQRHPGLAEAMQNNDSAKMLQIFNQIQSSMGGADAIPQNFNNPNEMDLEAQKKLLENIRLQNIQQNMESALEYMPEAFGNVVMLYIDCQVNGHHVKAFVDSGAQMTIMSAACAERCGIMRLVDSRWAGIAKGVGTQKIVGRVHLTQIQIEKSFLTTSFSILEDQPMDMLLGLDMLKRHQCIIDLQKNALIFSSANIETKFLPESELPGFARPGNDQEPSQDQEMDDVSKAIEESKKTASAPSTSKSSVEGSSSDFPESVVSALLKLGASRPDVIDALKECNGDQNQAQIKLLAKLLKSPSKK